MLDEVEWLVETYRGLLGRMTPEQIKAHLLRGCSAEKVEEAARRVAAEIERIRTLVPPPTMTGENGAAGWYLGPGPESRYWNSYRDLLQQKGWAETNIADLDNASTKIVSLVDHPGTGAFNRRGLVLGYIQSGKTANFTAVIAKSADAGYKMFVVLSGVTNKLRNQTQQRLEAELRGPHASQWVSLTAPNHDFSREYAQNADALLNPRTDQKALCVVKKNAFRLRLLRDWFRAASTPTLESCPVLIIDDEADQASLNAARPGGATRINALLREILAAVQKVAYIGYTATPFANVFVDPTDPMDLYPRDFIVDLPRPGDYFGPERIFGRDRLRGDGAQESTGLDVIREVPADEVPNLKPQTRGAAFEFDLTRCASLQSALEYFLIATAVRWFRGQRQKHSSMLIHPSQYVSVHQKYQEPLQRFIRETAAGISAGNGAVVGKLRALWENESVRTTMPEFGHAIPSFDQLRPLLREVLTECRVVVENYQTMEQDRLVYGDTPGVFVVVGGSVLARGLTLEGLVASFFVRTSNAYDTLLQMGRWFGYRPGYEDLPRIWMTNELRSYFHDLATVEQEIRNDITRYERESITPLQFAPRIRTHPMLMITSRLKMQNAVECDVSYSEKAIQTTMFRHLDPLWLERNLGAARDLVARASAAGKLEERAQGPLFRDVPIGEITRFLSAYEVHERSDDFRRDTLLDYIREENSAKGLLKWNVAIMGQRNSPLGSIELSRWQVNLIRRSRLKGIGGDEGYANIGALMSEPDVALDVPGLQAGASEGREDMLKMRSDALPDHGLVILYPIGRESRPDERRGNREPLAAVDDVIGLALVFPKTKRGSEGTVKYMTADLARLQPEMDELPPEILEEAE
jgi:hypothetical protein